MLDKIQGNISETIIQSQTLEKLNSIGASNPFIEDDKGYFIDQSDISSLALQKYQREQDINKFSEIFHQTNEKEANDLVLSKLLNGQISIDNDDIFMEMLNNKDFLNDVFNE